MDRAPTSADDPSEFPFECTWCLRAHMESDSHTYKVNYFHLTDVATIADWISLTKWLRPGAALTRPNVYYRVHHRNVSNVSLFRRDVRPEWEAPENEGGFTASIRGSFEEEQVNSLWDELVVEALREALPETVVGIQIARKWMRKQPYVKIDVWSTRNGDKDDTLARLNALVPFATESEFRLIERRFR